VTVASGVRGQSGIIGYVILMGLVLVAATLTVYAGSTAIGQLQSDQTDVNAQTTMEGVDSELSTLAASDESSRARLSVGTLDRGDVTLVRDGSINVTVNGNGTCATTVPLSSIRYENADGERVAYEAGGVWRATDNGSAMQTPPDVRFRNGSLDIAVVNMTGELDGETTPLFHDANSSRRESARRSRQLFAGSCARPTNVTLTVESDFATAWGAYLEDETGVEANVTGETVVVTLTRSNLPARVDNRRNNVVNMSNASYMDEVHIEGNTVRVSKNASNEYTVFVEPLGGDTLDIGREQSVKNAANISRPPLDVVIVMDESGSMGFPVTGAPNRLVAAREAARNFVATLNASTDRVGLVGYSSDNTGPSWTAESHAAWVYEVTAGEHLSDDFDEFNNTVGQTQDRGSTAGSAGLDRANTVLQFGSNQTRNRTVIFLSDGKFNEQHMGGVGPNEAAERRAEQAAEQGITVYTIGFGDGTDFNATVLKEMANRTGGEYFAAENQSQLNAVFQDISNRLVSTRQVGKIPTTTNLTTGSGDAVPPDVPGETSHIANASGEEFLNVNDPTAPSQFRHAFVVRDNESVTFNATTYECAQWEGTGIVRSHNGSTFQVTRCANMTTVNRTIGSDNTTVLYDGNDTTSLLAGDNPAWWQDDLRDIVEAHPDVDITAGNTLEMRSNQALVVLDYPDPGAASNRLVLLYEVGLSEEAATYDDIVNLRVENVTVGR